MILRTVQPPFIRFANFASSDCATVRAVRMIALHITISEGAATKKRPRERHFCIVNFLRHTPVSFRWCWVEALKFSYVGFALSTLTGDLLITLEL